MSTDFVNAFDWAVIRLATYYPASATLPRLLFGSVSLLTKDRPKPRSSDGYDSQKVGKGKIGKVFFRRTVLNAQEAIHWYRSAGTNGITTPLPTELSERIIGNDGISLTPTSFEDDPHWPSVGVPLGSDLFSNASDPGDPAPFRGPGAARIHRRFGDNSGFEALIADAKVIQFLRRRLHFDLSDYTEYLGGLALVVPDPLLRRVQHVLSAAEDAQGAENLTYRLIPRSGQNFDGLKLTIIERRSNLLSRFETNDVLPDGFVTVQSKLPFHQIGYAISHAVHGIVAYQQPVSFIRSVKMSLGVTGRKVVVQAPRTESPQSPTDNYEVTEYAHEIPIAVGEKRHDATLRVSSAEQRRIRRAAAGRYSQAWFDNGQREEAMLFIRSKIIRARSSVMVADPYFGAHQIVQFLHAVPSTKINFTILTSRLAFDDIYAATSESTQDEVAIDESKSSTTPVTMPERLRSFSASLETLRERGMKDVTALVLMGKPPLLHDRFLVIDDEVLFLGNSLNALGERASLILSVPDNEPVLAKLQSMAKLAQTFEAYAMQLQQQPPPPPEGA